jgi:hypothetical protein
MPLAEFPMLDDGACQRPLGEARELWSGATLGAASDGERTFFIDRNEGHLRVRGGDAPGVVATNLVSGPDRVGWGWLLVDRAHVYWVPGHVEGPRSSDLQLVRVPKGGGAVQKGFQPPGPVIAVHIDEWGGLLLTEEGLWRLDLRDWGKARLIRPGQYATMAADPRRAYLRPIGESGPMDAVAHQVLDDNGCREPDSTSIVSVDRRTGAMSDLYSSKELSLFGPLVADETHLYTAAAPTASVADEKGCRVRRLLRIGKETQTVTSRVVPVGIGGDLAQQGGRLFWIDGTSGRVFRTGKTGGPVVVVGQVPCRPNRLLLAGSSVGVWRADGGQCPLALLPANGEVASAAANLEAGDALLTVGGGWAYVANAEDQLRRISLAKGTAEPIRGRGDAPVTAIQAAVVGESLFFLGPDFLGRWSPGNEITRVFEGHARALALDGDQLYVALEDGSIAQLGNRGGPQTLVPGAGSAVRDLVAMNHAVYWTEGAGPNRGGGRTLFTLGPDRQRTQVLSIEGMDQIATDGRVLYYATEGRSRLLPGEREISGAIVRLAGGTPSRLADRQETVTDLRASRRGVFWRQRRGVRWVDEAGALRGLDCTVADQGVGLVEADGAVYWADGTARALMTARLPK